MTKPSISPVTWRPPRRSRGRGEALPDLTVIEVGGTGPEDVLVEASGTVLSGLADGRIIRIDGRTVTTVAGTGGRPLGLEHLPDGRVLVVDAERGLLALDLATGDLEVLLTEVEGSPLVFPNNAAVAPDGTIWFSESSARHPLAYWEAEIAEHSGTGRIIRRDPDGTAATVATGLQFPNGLALGSDGTSLFCAETGAFTLTRFTLDRPAGAGAVIVRTDLVAPSLPGYPDNISLGSDGLVWVAMASPRNPVMDVAARLPGVVRRVGWALPHALQPKPSRKLGVVAIDPATGAVVHDLRSGRHPRLTMITGVREQGGTLWLGSLLSTVVASLKTP